MHTANPNNTNAPKIEFNWDGTELNTSVAEPIDPIGLIDLGEVGGATTPTGCPGGSSG